MRKQQIISSGLVIVLVVAAALAAGPAAAQESLVVWYTVDNIGPVMEQVSADFTAATGVAVEIQFVRPQQLFDAVAKATTGGPDVILASSDDIGPLVENKLVRAGGPSPSAFLTDVLGALPALLDSVCTDDDLAACLWPDATAILALSRPTDQLTNRTENWLCSAADWMCPNSNFPGRPLSWWFNIYLISDSWLAENGLFVPADVTGIDELRSKYGVSYVWANERSLPDAAAADMSTVYIFPSALLVQDPTGLMESLSGFDAVGYLPVVEIGIDGLFISSTSANPSLAQQYVDFVAQEPELKIEIMVQAHLLPALSAADLRGLEPDAEGTAATLRGIILLTAYTGLVY